MTYPPVAHSTQAPPQPPPAGRNAMPWILAAVALIVIVGAAAAVFVSFQDGAGEKPASAPQAAPTSAQAATISVSGSIKLGLGDFAWDQMGQLGNPGPTCAGDGGYSDIVQGASVTVTDAAGTVVALGQLDSSIPTGFSEAKTPTACELKFSVPGVPAGKGFYGIEVSHRGAVRFEESKLTAPVELELG